MNGFYNIYNAIFYMVYGKNTNNNVNNNIVST